MANYSDSPLDWDAELRSKAQRYPQPLPTKTMPGMRIDLPEATINGSLGDALTSRRTWRRFSSRPVPLTDLATLLRVTWGVQRWGVVKGQGRIALKTSPSGGARHSLEAYVVARNVAGLPPGMYHYDAATHELVHLGEGIPQERLCHVLASQRWFLGAGAFVVMSAVFERAMWRYPSSRVYRAILAEARPSRSDVLSGGHVARPGALLHHGVPRSRSRRPDRRRRHQRVRDVCGRRGHAAARPHRAPRKIPPKDRGPS